MDKLLACPFCGWRELFVHSGVGKHWVRCTQCDASTKMHSSVKDAIKAWNRRSYPDFRKLVDKWPESIPTDELEQLLRGERCLTKQS